MSYLAPIAPMMGTPSNRSAPTGTSRPAWHRSYDRARPISPPRTRSNGKETQDYQAQADRMEEARDLADPDYRVSQETPPKKRSVEAQTTPRKRSAVDDISPSSAKKHSPGHKAFDSLQDKDSKNDRRKHLARIRKNWGQDPEQWMPESVWPCKFVGSGNRRTRRLIDDPRDWNSPLLKELFNLCVVTRNQPAVAYQALEGAVLQRQEDEGSNEETQVLKEDAKYAAEICKAAQESSPTPGPAPSPTPGPAPPEEDDDIAEEPATDGRADEIPHGLPDVRSPTVAGDAPTVNIHHQATPMQLAAESLSDSAWNDEMDKLEEARLEAEEKEALVAARRAQREHIAQRRRMREMLRQRRRTEEDAIRLGPDVGGL